MTICRAWQILSTPCLPMFLEPKNSFQLHLIRAVFRLTMRVSSTHWVLNWVYQQIWIGNGEVCNTCWGVKNGCFQFLMPNVGECKDFYLKFMICLAENGNLTSACRDESKAYLGCRYIQSKTIFGLLDGNILTAGWTRSWWWKRTGASWDSQMWKRKSLSQKKADNVPVIE